MASQVLKQIRIVTPRFGTAVIGGAETLARQLALALVDQGINVTVWTTCAQEATTWRNVYQAGETIEEGILLRRFPVALPRYPQAFRQFSRLFFRYKTVHWAERFWFWSQGPWSPGLIASLKHNAAIPTLFIPYLYHPIVYGLPACQATKILIPAAHDEKPFGLPRIQKLLTTTDAIWYSTPEEKQLTERVHPVAKSKPHAIGTTGISLPPTTNSYSFRKQWNITGPYLLSGGRNTPGKGMEALLIAFTQLRTIIPNVNLVVIGANKSSLPVQAGIIATGYLEEQDKWDALSGATAIVIPGELESLSLLALEAWAVGKPTLMNTNAPVLKGQTERSNAGLLYCTATEFTNAAQKLLDNALLAQELGKNGVLFINNNYRWEQVVGRLVSLLAKS